MIEHTWTRHRPLNRQDQDPRSTRKTRYIEQSTLSHEERWLEDEGCRYASTPTMQHRERHRLRFMHYEKGSTSLYQHPLFSEQSAAPGASITSFLPCRLYLSFILPSRFCRLLTRYVSSLCLQFPSFTPSSRCSRCFSSPLGPMTPTLLIKTFGTSTTTTRSGIR